MLSILTTQVFWEKEGGEGGGQFGSPMATVGEQNGRVYNASNNGMYFNGILVAMGFVFDGIIA